MLVAGDVGGTKTLLGLFERADPRPRQVAVRTYDTNAYPSFMALLDAFTRDVGQPFAAETIAIGVAGPVVAQRARLTNITWDISSEEIATRFSKAPVLLLNDLEAMAHGVGVLQPDEVVVLQDGIERRDGNAVVIAAGTGLGQAYLHRVGAGFRPVPSEGGHADFAARTDREMDFTRMMRAERGRVEVEDVLCGPGLLNLHRFTHAGAPCPPLAGVSPHDAPAAVSQAALDHVCEACVAALAMFVSAYGAEAGNLALRGVAVSGVFVGGGIAPKILPALQDGSFMAAFGAKGVMTELLSKMPVKVILNEHAGLLGAAVAAAEIGAPAQPPR